MPCPNFYEDPQLTATAEALLHTLQQGCRAAEDYVAEFRQRSSDTNWNNAALRFQFHMGLLDPLKDELSRVGVPLSLDALINLSIQTDQRLREWKSERSMGQPRPTWILPRVPSFSNPAPSVPSASAPDTSESMQLGLLRPSLTVEERQRRHQNYLCLYCGEPGHFVRSCPAKLRKCLSISSDLSSAMPNKMYDFASHSVEAPRKEYPGFCH